MVIRVRPKKDMTAPNWGRSYKRLIRNVQELEGYGAIVVLPPDFHVPPSQRIAGRS